MRHERVHLRLGPFSAVLSTAFDDVVDALERLYPPQFREPRGDFVDFHVQLVPGKGMHRYVRPQARLLIDGQDPFKPLPAAQALPLVEWGLNYAIAGLAHQYLIVHAAVIEKNGRVALLPGAPGSGKSTLAAGLVHRGWRLLSDELALIRREDGQVVPLARPVNLKNESIDLLKAFARDAVFSKPVADTVKGTVALMRAPEDSLARIDDRAPIGWIVFPRWRAGASAAFVTFSKAASLIEIGHHAMNYSLHGAQGFGVLSKIIERSACYRFTYGNLDDAACAFDALAAAA